MRTELWNKTCLGNWGHFKLGNMPVLNLIPLRLISSQCPSLFYTTVGLSLASHNLQAFTLANLLLGLTNEITGMTLECWRREKSVCSPPPPPLPALDVVSSRSYLFLALASHPWCSSSLCCGLSSLFVPPAKCWLWLSAITNLQVVLTCPFWLLSISTTQVTHTMC